MVAGLVVREKNKRVANYQDETITSVSEIIGAMGIESPEDLHPWHIMRRTSPTEIKHYGEIYEFLNAGDLIKDPLPISYKRACQSASAETFQHVNV